MVEYEIRQSENGLARTYNMFMDRLSEHITLLAKKGKPFSSVMGVKRGIYKYRKLIQNNTMVAKPNTPRLWHPPQGGACRRTGLISHP